MTREPIKTAFRRSGMEYTQLERRGNTAIYRQHRVGAEPRHDCFEVIKIGAHDGYTMGGAFIPPAETYPGASQWGVAGWTYRTLAEAKEKLQELAPRRVIRRKVKRT